MKNLILPFILLLTLVFSCRENDIDEGFEKKTGSYDVYVAGEENNIACYWKNGIKTNLVNGTNITARKIIVENNDVYVFATSNGSPNYYIWKNNAKIDINQHIGMNNNTTNPSDYHHVINDFQVEQGNIFLFGFVSSPIIQLPNGNNFNTIELCYWKNGVKTLLFTSNSNFNQSYVTTRNFTVYNGDVYTPVNKILNKLSNSPYELGYFKNSIYHTVASNSEFKSFTHISKGSNGVYLSIHDNINNNTYYKNLISNTDSYFSQTNKGKFYIDGTDIYDFNNGSNYLKNDIAIPLTYASGFDNIVDLLALNQNVYQIRSKFTSDIKESSKVYINNTEVQHINVINGTFNSIFVVEN